MELMGPKDWVAAAPVSSTCDLAVRGLPVAELVVFWLGSMLGGLVVD